MTGPTGIAQHRIRYQPALDGLRAIAVAAVLLYHDEGLRAMGIGRGGFIGVDVFFVLSGFLITSLLVVEREGSGSIAFRRFWSRRARRLLPALLLMLVLVAVLSQTVYPPIAVARVRNDLWYTLTYLQNWHVAIWHGGTSSPISHTWSLSVEEQWYLIWPLAVGLLFWRGRLHPVAHSMLLVALAIGSALWTAYLFDHFGNTRAYFGTDTRAQELLIGAALAIVASSGFSLGRRARAVIDGAALVLLAGFVVVVVSVGSGSGWFDGGFLVLSLAVAVMIVAAVQPSGVFRSVLSIAPLVVVGQLSYGLYLFHFPVYQWLDAPATGLAAWPLLGLRVLVTATLAALSFHLVEQPVRRGRVSGRRLLAVGSVAVVGVVAATSVGVALADTGSEVTAARLCAAKGRAEGTSSRDSCPCGRWKPRRVALAHEEGASPRERNLGTRDRHVWLRAVVDDAEVPTSDRRSDRDPGCIPCASARLDARRRRSRSCRRGESAVRRGTAPPRSVGSHSQTVGIGTDLDHGFAVCSHV